MYLFNSLLLVFSFIFIVFCAAPVSFELLVKAFPKSRFIKLLLSLPLMVITVASKYSINKNEFPSPGRNVIKILSCFHLHFIV